jgi:hypothetical protein
MRRQIIAIAGAALCAVLCGAAPANASTTTWRVQAVSKPPNGGPTKLFSVSCPARGICTAVGFYDNKATSRTDTLAEHWDGTSWTIQPTPNPTRSQVSRLLSVSCLSATDCTAVALSAKLS